MKILKYSCLILPLLLLFESCQEKGADRIMISDYYNEPHRLQFHFSPDSMWMNDPNGMVYFAGEYHMFYQYYPDDIVWGPMHWGHAISKDLIHWEHMPIAIYPDSLGWIFSGSAVADLKNTSGFGTRDNPPLVAIYTYHDSNGQKAGRADFQTQGIAYSVDKGRTWEKYQGNPVLRNPGIKDYRDPKVLWHEETKKWIMILAVKDRVHLYSSADLKAWNKESEFGADKGAHGGVWECPDLIPMTIGDQTKWVMLVSINPGGPNGGSATQYFVGDFNGSYFNVDHDDLRWLDWGPDNYAGVTWSNVNNRHLFIGWMSNWAYATQVPTEKWRSSMTVPRSLKLSKVDNKLYVVSEPVDRV
jgi:fructan beta-fructosidase